MENLYTLYPKTKYEKEMVKKSFLPFIQELGLTKNSSIKEYIDTSFEKFLQGDYEIAENLAKKLNKKLARKNISQFKNEFENYLHYNPIYAMATLFCYQNSMEGGLVQKNSKEIILDYIENGGNYEIFHLRNLQNIEKYINELHYVSFRSGIDFANNFRKDFSVSPLETLFISQYNLVHSEQEINRLTKQLLSYKNQSKAPNFIKSKISALKSTMSNNKKLFNSYFDKCDAHTLKNIAMFKDKYLETLNKIKHVTNSKTASFNMVFLDKYQKGGYYPQHNNRIYDKVEAKINQNTMRNDTPSK